jgi:hypothetical protein
MSENERKRGHSSRKPAIAENLALRRRVLGFASIEIPRN